MATLNISLPDDMREWIESQVASGRYANASDYIRDLIRNNQASLNLSNLSGPDTCAIYTRNTPSTL